jgi:hypothetical protein
MEHYSCKPKTSNLNDIFIGCTSYLLQPRLAAQPGANRHRLGGGGKPATTGEHRAVCW